MRYITVHLVTNYYFGEYSQCQSKLSSSGLAVRARVFRISGGDSSYSWVLVCALDLFVKEEFKAVMLGGELDMWGTC